MSSRLLLVIVLMLRTGASKLTDWMRAFIYGVSLIEFNMNICVPWECPV